MRSARIATVSSALSATPLLGSDQARAFGRARRLLLSFATTVALLAPAVAAAPAGSPPFTSDCAWSDEVVGRFLRSVERGELVVFGRTLAGDQLSPVRIEYAVELGSRAQTVSVHAWLAVAIPLPNDDTMVVRSVAAVMGQDGRIVETRLNVTLK